MIHIDAEQEAQFRREEEAFRKWLPWFNLAGAFILGVLALAGWQALALALLFAYGLFWLGASVLSSVLTLRKDRVEREERHHRELLAALKRPHYDAADNSARSYEVAIEELRKRHEAG
jgi:DNA-binding GntR family transcriptional regulator